MREQQWAEEDAYSSDLDVDLTNENDFNIKELQVNFKILVPEDHKYIKQFTHYFKNIEDGNAKAQSYERFLFDLLLDSPRCEHCLAPLENNNVSIKNHINYYHFDIKI